MISVSRPAADSETEQDARSSLVAKYPGLRIARLNRVSTEDGFFWKAALAGPDEEMDEMPMEDPAEDKPKEHKEDGGKDSQILKLVKQIAEAVGVSSGGHDDQPPGASEHPSSPLPPPVSPQHPLQGLGPAAANVINQNDLAGRRTVIVASKVEGSINDAVAELNAAAAPFRVAKINRKDNEYIAVLHKPIGI